MPKLIIRPMDGLTHHIVEKFRDIIVMIVLNVQIPAGTKVSATIVEPMRSEKHFQNADKFIPGKQIVMYVFRITYYPSQHNFSPESKNIL